MIKAKSELNCCRRFIFKLSLLASIDVVFWPVVTGALYVAIGILFLFAYFPECFVALVSVEIIQ